MFKMFPHYRSLCFLHLKTKLWEEPIGLTVRPFEAPALVTQVLTPGLSTATSEQNSSGRGRQQLRAKDRTVAMLCTSTESEVLMTRSFLRTEKLFHLYLHWILNWDGVGNPIPKTCESCRTRPILSIVKCTQAGETRVYMGADKRNGGPRKPCPGLCRKGTLHPDDLQHWQRAKGTQEGEGNSFPRVQPCNSDWDRDTMFPGSPQPLPNHSWTYLATG